jgi:Domain of unknown function (DUF2019)
MRHATLTGMTVEKLVEQFTAITLAQDQALLRREIAKFNRLFAQMEKVEFELKSRPGDKRTELLKLFDHPNMQVQLAAAKSTLAIAPEMARRKIEEIANSGWFPQAGDAGMSLWNLDRGIFKPT